MAKNFAAIYSSGNDSNALNQRIFIKEELLGARGQLVLPTPADFIYHLEGASVNFAQPVESSPHKTDRHHSSVIKQKTTTEWTLPTLFNINSSLPAASANEIDPGMRVLFKSLLGREFTIPVLGYDAALDPYVTFSIFENLDVMAKQTPGCAVNGCSLTFPGDGQAQMEWNGMAKTSFYVGLGKSTVDNNGNIGPGGENVVSVLAGEGRRFPVGGKVMIIKADGVTRSLDTPVNTARTIVGVIGDDILLDGAILADADGSGATPVYLCYYEPVEPFIAINDPQTGLQGTVEIAGLPSAMCVRSAEISVNNNHEWEDYCYGKDGLGSTIFTPAGRLDVEVTMELNLTKEMVGYINQSKEFIGENITIYLGPALGRRMQIVLPRVIFEIPAITVPGTGTIPVQFTGMAYQSGLGLADEININFL